MSSLHVSFCVCVCVCLGWGGCGCGVYVTHTIISYWEKGRKIGFVGWVWQSSLKSERPYQSKTNTGNNACCLKL